MLRVEVQGARKDVAVWTIDRPRAKNALDRRTLADLLEAAEAARKDTELRAIVLTGAGDAFVSGADLRELRGQNSADDARSFAAAGSDLCDALEALPVPVIAAVPGPAFGGGAELALACDLRLGDPQARFSFKQVRMGVTPAWGTAARLVAAIGRSSAARLLYTAQEVRADAALAMGLLDAVSPPGESLLLALEWADDIALGSPTAVAKTKAILAAARPDLRALERESFVATWTSPDHVDAVDAYFAKRAVVWRRRADD